MFIVYWLHSPVLGCYEQMPFVTKQPAYNILYELILRTIEAVKELDSLQAERFQRKIRFVRQEPNGEASDGVIASAPPEEVSTGDESAVCLADSRITFSVSHTFSGSHFVYFEFA